jgi:hypothetical protein
MPDPFIDQQDLTDYLGRDVTTDDGALAAVDAACDMCRTLSEQTFNAVVADTITLDGTGTDALLLPERPVSAAGTVTVNGGTVTDYVLGGNGILFRRGTVTSDWCWPGLNWPYGRQNICVTYNHGYAAVDLPRDVRMVALSIASRLVVQGVAKSESQGDLSVTYATAASDLTANELRILRKYRQTRSF